ncbi:hypothetical protein [Pseudomonas aeruginosa]|uniref:hypothetical protein n=1 Tax=Pseudomonas aeruginosa TaxID=287 RepID=UPI00177E38F6|nr:hypothetical protein [Pseudomonas aeruginosa]
MLRYVVGFLAFTVLAAYLLLGGFPARLPAVTGRRGGFSCVAEEAVAAARDAGFRLAVPCAAGARRRGTRRKAHRVTPARPSQATISNVTKDSGVMVRPPLTQG